MAGGTVFGDGAVVKYCIEKSTGVMAIGAIQFGDPVVKGFAPGNTAIAVMASLAVAGNLGVIIAAVCGQFHKALRVMTFIAFHNGDKMPLGFADSPYAVVAFTAITKHFIVVRKGHLVETEDRVTGLAQV